MSVDWPSLLQVESSLLETVVRGSLMYLALFVMFRLLVRRSTGRLSMSELLGGFSVRLREDRHGDGDDWEDGAPGAG